MLKISALPYRCPIVISLIASTALLYTPLSHPENATASTEEPSYSELKTTLDWLPVSALTQDQREALRPGSCGAYIAPIRKDAEALLNPDAAPIRARANRSVLTENAESQSTRQVLLIDDVLVTQGYRQLQAQQAQLDESTNTLIMEGNLILREPGILVLGDKILIQQNQENLQVDRATYVLQDQHLRGRAEQITRGRDGKIKLDSASFTQCEPDNNTWLLQGSQIILDTDASQGHAKHVRLIVKGMPVFYFPYLRFPLGDKRLSGFLAPSFEFGDDGNNVSIPYYFNLAPNYDLLFTTHFLEQHGWLYEGQYRHLNHFFSSALNLFYLNDDDSELSENQQSLVDDGTISEQQATPFRGEDRWLVNLYQTGGEGRAWSTKIDYSDLSDVDFFRDFDQSDIADDKDSFLNQSIETGYRFKHWAVGLNTLDYQALSTTATEPFEQLPALTIDGAYALENWTLELDNEWIRFDRSDNDVDNPPLTGSRLRLDYALNWNYEPQWGFFKPSVMAKHLQYRLDDNNFADGAGDSPSISVPQAKVDMGLFFERDGSRYLQTFEPRLFYFYSDFEDHGALFNVTTDGKDIDYDTTALGFSFSQLFRDTRFSGGDRIDDANQLALGLTTRFIGYESGREWFSASLGQITYFEDRRVSLSNAPQTSNQSDIVAQIRSLPLEHLSLSSDLTYSDIEHQISQGNIKLRYQNQSKHLLGLSYRYTRGSTDDNSTKEYQASIIAPLLSERWHLMLFSAYDAVRKRELQTLSAIEYSGCCYRISLGYRSQLDTSLVNTVADDELEYEYQAFFGIHFKGLGGTSKRLDLLFEEEVDGFGEWRAIYQ
ncbi:MAG: LPS assembly protein LptD [Pseudomonadota bacterium]